MPVIVYQPSGHTTISSTSSGGPDSHLKLALITMFCINPPFGKKPHYSDVIMHAMVSQVTSVSIVYIIVCSGLDQINHQSSASLATVKGIHRWPVNSSHKRPVTRKCFHLMTSSFLWIMIVLYCYCQEMESGPVCGLTQWPLGFIK